jgi:hypothetical protein
MAGLNDQACGVLDLASAARARFFQSIPIKIKSPTSIRKVTLMIVTGRNTLLTERGFIGLTVGQSGPRPFPQSVEMPASATAADRITLLDLRAQGSDIAIRGNDQT